MGKRERKGQLCISGQYETSLPISDQGGQTFFFFGFPLSPDDAVRKDKKKRRREEREGPKFGPPTFFFASVGKK